jgi:hypothetical protein
MSTSDNRRRAFESLIEQGLAVPVPGKTRPGRDGKPQQVYVHRDWAEKMGLPLPPLKPRRPWENEDDGSAGAEP